MEIPYEHYEVHGVPMSLLTGDNNYYISWCTIIYAYIKGGGGGGGGGPRSEKKEI